MGGREEKTGEIVETGEEKGKGKGDSRRVRMARLWR